MVSVRACILLLAVVWKSTESAGAHQDLDIGSACHLSDGSVGQCVLVQHCPSAIAETKKTRQIYRGPSCGLTKNFVQMACCKDVPPRKSDEACEDFKIEMASIVTGGFAWYEHNKRNELPHMAALGFKKSEDLTPMWYCSGSLISKNHVLTAAHCREIGERNLVEVRLGTNNLTDETSGLKRRVQSFIAHPKYNSRTDYHDIAIIVIASVPFGEDIQPACLYKTPKISQNEMFVAGWGKTRTYGPGQRSEVLMKAGMDPWPLKLCKERFGDASINRPRGFQPEMFCAKSSENSVDTCQSDSVGGVLQVPEPSFSGGFSSIVGITSFGQPLCGWVDGVGVYTKVSSYLDWIESIVWPDTQ